MSTQAAAAASQDAEQREAAADVEGIAKKAEAADAKAASTATLDQATEAQMAGTLACVGWPMQDLAHCQYLQHIACTTRKSRRSGLVKTTASVP